MTNVEADDRSLRSSEDRRELSRLAGVKLSAVTTLQTELGKEI